MSETPNGAGAVTLSDADWCERFAARVVALWQAMPPPPPDADPDEYIMSEGEARAYGADVAPSYLETRGEYSSPEEAAETDVGYWGE